MSLANDLLRTLSVEEDDKTLVIDHYTRTISIPNGIKTLGVESDDDVLRLNFKMPRYLGTVDLYNFSIRVNYINAEGEDDVYKVTDKAIVGNNITFSWLVGPTAVAYKGITKFNVSLVVTDSNSVVKQEYNTAIASLPVLEGMETSERVVSEYTDILEQWERRLFGIGDTEEAKLLAFSEEQQTNITEKGAEVLATIPEDYQTTYKLANEGVRSKADAIICSAEGEVITVHDSSDDYLRGLKVFGKTTQVKTTGKNLLPYPYVYDTKTANGVDITVYDDGTILFNGTATAGISFHLSASLTLPAGEYILSGCPSGGSLEKYRIYFSDNATKTVADYGESSKFTLNQAFTGQVVIQVYTGAVMNNLTFKPMIRPASVTDSTYEPYTGGVPSPSPEYPQPLVSPGDNGCIGVTVSGKNLCPYPYVTSTTTISGVDVIMNADGTITLNGTATDNAWFGVTGNFTLPAGSYAVRVLPDDWDNSYGYVIWSGNDGHFDEFNIILKEPTECNLSVTLYKDAKLNNVVLKPQIEFGSTCTEYEPPVGKNVTTVRNGLPGIPVTAGGNYTDSNGQQWICDEIDFERGVYVKRIDKLVLDGTAKWTEYTYETTHYGFMIWDLLSETHYRSPGMSNQFRLVGSGSGECIWVGASNACIYAITNEWYDKGLAAWKAHLNETPLEIIYRSTNPIETPLTADELAVFQALKTNYPNTTVLNDAGAWMNLRYNADTKTWISNLIDSKIAAYLEGVSS